MSTQDQITKKQIQKRQVVLKRLDIMEKELDKEVTNEILKKKVVLQGVLRASS